jgi:sec-independent protein translocase protein TatA
MGIDNPVHIAFLLFVLLIVFGAKRLPELGRSLGGGMRGFRDAITGVPAEPALPAAAASPAAASPVAVVATLADASLAEGASSPTPRSPQEPVA